MEDLNTFIQGRCTSEFQALLLRDYLPHFMAPSTGRGRRSVAQLVGALVLARHFEDCRDTGIKQYAQARIAELIDAFLQEVAQVTNAVDKGRCLIDNEFEADVFLASEEEVDALLKRGKRFAAQGFQPRSEQDSALMEAFWETVERNTKTRNERVKVLEERINEAAVLRVLELYSAELMKATSKSHIQDETMESSTSVGKVNDTLAADCVKVLTGLRNYRGATGGVKATLADKMADFYRGTMDSRRRRDTQATAGEAHEQEEPPMHERISVPHPVVSTTPGTTPPSPSVAQDSHDDVRTPQHSGGTSTSPSSNSEVKTPPTLPLKQERGRKSGPSTAPPSFAGGSPPTRILVIHLARGSCYKVLVVVPSLSRAAAGSSYATVRRVPAYIVGVGEDEFSIGTGAQSAPGAICLQNAQAGSELYPLLPGGVMVRYEVLLGLFLAITKQKFEHELGLGQQSFTACLLVVPASLNPIGRQAVVDAASMAGFGWIRLLSEPTAAACDYYTQCLSTTKLAISYALGMVLYMSDNGELELGLYKLKITAPRVEMLGLSGSFVRRHPSMKILPSTAGVVREYAKDAVTGSRKAVNRENISLVVTGDCDGLPREAVTGRDRGEQALEGTQKCVFTRPRHADEAAIQGGAGLARKMIKGEPFSRLCSEKLWRGVSIKLPRGHTQTQTKEEVVPIFCRNDPLLIERTVRFKVDPGDRDLAFSLLDSETGLQLAEYVIQFDCPVEGVATEYEAVCVLLMDENGTVRVKATLQCHGMETKPLRVQRKGSLNKEEIHRWEEYVRGITLSSPNSPFN